MAVEENSAPSQRGRSLHKAARRIYVMGGALGLGLLLIAGRLAKLQVIDGREYAELAKRQSQAKVTLEAERGQIFDRNGNLLATNVASYSFAVDPRHLENPKKLAAAFAAAFGESADTLLKRMSAKDREFVWIRRKVYGPALDKLKDLADDGLIKIQEPLRRFEYDSLGAQAIGCTDVDSKGMSGVELYYNDQLKGEDGYIIMQRDAQGHKRPDVDLPQVPPQHGNGLVLTLDINTQEVVEEELRRGVITAGAASGTAIAIEPQTGEILAIANYPSYNPNVLGSADPNAVRVRAISDMYEPGSTMKAVTASAALEENVIGRDERFSGEGGVYQVGNHTIHDDHPMADMNFEQAFEESSNIGFAKIASKLSAPRFYKYVRDFGFGITTGIDLPGEAKGQVKKPNEFTDGTQQFMAFGYELAVTPLQLVSAYAAIANGGLMMKPHILKRRLDREGGVLEDVQAQEIRRVISEKTATSVREMMVGVVENGTGRAARIPGLRIAGKTGTAQQLSDGTYSKEKYNASFVGFFPADAPKVALLVLLDSPSNGYYGGQVAAPIFREIARRIINATMQGTESDLMAATPNDSMPVRLASFGSTRKTMDFRGLDVVSALLVAENAGVKAVPKGNGKVVIGQTPAPGVPTDGRSPVELMVLPEQIERRMPDVRGLSLRRAMNLLAAFKIKPRISGSGKVIGQTPVPGVALKNEDFALLRCE